jgi:DNA-binding SARP family transcriptional activator/tetratricopeptide (TPR) repeat protein
VHVETVRLRRLKVAGELAFYLGEESTPTRLRSKTALELLAILVLRRGEALSRDWLEEALWPESDGDRRSQNLRRALADVRQALSFPDQTNSGLCIERSTVRLATGAVQLDTLLTGSGGSFLVGVDRSWAIPFRRQLEQQEIDRLEDQRTAAVSRTEWQALKRTCLDMLVSFPTKSAPYEILIETCGRLGEPTEAIQYFEEFAKMLDEEFGEQPSPRAVDSLNVEPLLELPTAASAAFQDYAIGRSELVQSTILTVLSQPPGEWVTLIGPPGVGKTSVSKAIVELLQDTRTTHFIPLAEASSANDAVLLIARECGLSTSSASLDKLCAFLSERIRVIVLDNAEHLSNDLISVLEAVANVSTVRLLVTSRIALGGHGEEIIEVPLISSSADRLAILRRYAPLVKPDSISHAADMDELAGQLDGHPLSMQLAASLMMDLTPREVINLVSESRLRRTEWDQHLSTAIRWSFDRLSPVAKRVFRAATVLTGEFTAEELLGAAGTTDVQCIDELLRHSLLKKMNHRLRMMMSIRDLAVAVTTIDHCHAFEANLASFYVGQLSRQRKRIDGPEYIEAFKEFETYEENLMSLLRRIRDRRDLFDEIATICYSGYVQMHAMPRNLEWANVIADIPCPDDSNKSSAILGYAQALMAAFKLPYETARTFCDRVESRFESFQQTDQVAAKLVNILFRLIRSSEQDEVFEQCLVRLFELGHLELHDGEYWDALTVKIRIHHFKGVAYRILNRPDDALMSYNEGLGLAEANGVLRMLAPQSHAIADVCIDSGRYREAREWLAKALMSYELQAALQNYPALLQTYAFLKCKTGDFLGALEIVDTLEKPSAAPQEALRSRLMIAAAVLFELDEKRSYECFKLANMMSLDHGVHGPFVRGYFPDSWFDGEQHDSIPTVLVKVKLLNHVRFAKKMLHERDVIRKV